MGGDRQKEELKGEGRYLMFSALCDAADAFREQSTWKMVSLKPQQLTLTVWNSVRVTAILSLGMKVRPALH